MRDIQQVVAFYFNRLGAGEYRVVDDTDKQNVYLGLELLATLTYDPDGYLTITVVDELLRALNSRFLDEAATYRLPLAHPGFFTLLISLLIP